MCGIVALLLGNTNINKKYFLFNTLLKSLRALQNRGYDSCGIMDSRFNCILKAVKKNELQENINVPSLLPDDAIDQIKLCQNKFPHLSTCGIAHTRWATSGKKTIPNAHPHLSMNNTLAVVHNGIIENYIKLRDFLEKNGYKFRSETDTEVISNWIEYNLPDNPSVDDILNTLQKAQKTLEGSWGVALIHKSYPDSLFLLKNGSPLLLGYDRKTKMIMATSEIAGFVNRVDKYAVLNEDEILHVKRNQEINTIRTNIRKLKFENVPTEIIHLSPDPFPHWMTKEIYDQIKAIEGPAEWGKYKNKTMSNFPELKKLFLIRDKLLTDKIDNFDVLIVGCGTSYHAGLAGRWFFKSVPFRTVRVVVASEFTTQDLPKSKNGTPPNVIAILVSQSGETKDVHRAMKIIKDANIKTISLVNVKNSLIARESDVPVYLHAGREVAVASTKAYVCQLVGLKILSNALKYGREAIITDDFKILSEQIKSTLKSIFPYQPYVGGKHLFEHPKSFNDMANCLNQKNHGFILSTGKLRAIAYEAALKIKEIGRIWVQGYPTGALKHGPFSLLENNTPVLFSLQDDDEDTLRRTEAAIEEVHARGAKVFLTTDIENYENKNVEHIIHLPRNKTFSAVINIIPYQALAYYLSIVRNLDPDKPVHLAKVVTTD
jgi:glucosamine--fructose-6-phosphate aminotransferase (isomerizing)